MTMKLENRVAFITGGGAGMGRATVELFLDQGAQVFAIDIDGDRLADLRRAVESDRLATGLGDISKAEDIARLAKEAQATFGDVDILVNNAGIFDYGANTLNITMETWDKVFAINVTSHLLLAREFLPAMIARGDGAIIGISSASGLVAGGGGIGYTASKHAVIGLCKQMSFEYGPKGVRVNAVCPGITKTPLLDTALAAEGGSAISDFAATIPAGRLCRPEEVAKVVAFVASEDASFMFGSAISVDGGYTSF